MMGNGFPFCVESNATGFLGIELGCNDDGAIELKQSTLIQRIIDTLGFQNASPRATPAEVAELPVVVDGLGPQGSWSYNSVVGMLMYLAGTTHPDISMPVHQCARYSHNSQRCHEKAVKHIVHYLISNKDTRPGTTENDQNPVCVKSRTGFVLTLGQILILWISKIQSEITCSTIEADYIALSHSMRELLPVRWLVEELAKVLKLERDSLSTIYTVWEDNQGALTLVNALMSRMTPCSKHIGIKYH
eukprot:14088860-Ditylum_brightwellii.AAC.1